MQKKHHSLEQQMTGISAEGKEKKSKKAYAKPEMKAHQPLEKATTTVYYYHYYVFSSKTLKESMRPVSSTEILSAIKELPVERWKYLNHQEEHIGPYAEDFRALFGVGDGKTINVIDAIGVLMASVKALAKEVDELKRRLNH